MNLQIAVATGQRLSQPGAHPPSYTEPEPSGSRAVSHRDFDGASRSEVGDETPGWHVTKGVP